MMSGRGSVWWIHNDGGRAAAGYRGTTGDCVVRAVAIASGRPYQEVYDQINEFVKTERRSRRKMRRSSAANGVYNSTIRRMLAPMGVTWTPTMGIGTGCRVHLRADELPPGYLVVSLSRHVAAVINGIVHDTYDPTRGGTRCVYGYWTFPRPVR